MPNLPSVTSPLPRDLQTFIQRVREAIDGGGLDGLVSARQMVSAGLASFSNGTVASTNLTTIEAPRPPTGLAGSGALATVIVSWDSPSYLGHSYTEVWASTTSLVTQAVLVGMTAGNNFSHGIGSGATRYYWAKNVNRNGLASAFNATSGVAVTTGDDPEYLMDVLSSAIGGDSEAPFFQIDAATTINGVSIPAGTYMKAAFIADATITNAKINSLTADKISASLLNTVDFYGNTIAGSTMYLGGTVTYSQTNGVNTGIASIANPNVTMASSGATFQVGAFKIDNGNNTQATPFQVVSNVAYINNGMIKDSTLSFAKVADDIQSSDYSAGSAGWKIAKGGAMEMNNATFRGSLDVGGSSGSRLTITSTKLQVFDGSTLRVKIGDLS